MASTVLFGCHKKTVPAASAKDSGTVKSEVKTEAPGEAGKLNMAYLNAGQKVYESSCGKCHDLKKPDTYTQERWVGLVNWMAPKAKVTDEEKAKVLADVRMNAKDVPKDKSLM